MRHVWQGWGGMATAFVLGAVVATAATATAATLITGRQIKDGSVTGRDLSRAVRAQLRKVGRTGPRGLPGPAGAPGARGLSSWDTIPSGQTVTGSSFFDASATVSDDFAQSVALPARAPQPLTDATVNFATDSKAATTDDDASCTGTLAAPTAPPGKVCLYYGNATGDTSQLRGDANSDDGGRSSFFASWRDDHTGDSDVFVDFAWAYTAP